MKMQKEVERLTSMCNGMNSTTEIMRKENKILEESKSPDIAEAKEKKKILPNTKLSKKRKLKRRRIVKTNLEKKEKQT